MSANSISFVNKIRKHTHNSLENSTLHAIPNILKSKEIIKKIVWTIFFIISFGFCLYFISKNLLDLFENEVVTNVDLIHEEHPIFPKITICQNSIHDLLIYSSFVRQPVQLQDLGSDCLVFNSGRFNESGDLVDTFSSSVPGYDLGFFFQFLNPNVSNKLKVYINNQSVHFNPPEAVTFNSKLTTQISLSREFTRRLGKPYSNCRRDLIIPMISKNGSFNSGRISYHQTNCFKLYELKEMALKCNQLQEFSDFSHYFYLNVTHFNALFADLKDNCLGSNEIQQSISEMIDKEGVFEKYGNDCPPECDSMVYKKSYNYDLRNQGNQIGALRIYFKELEYTFISESPKINSSEMFGVIGGILAFFLGISLLSFVELLDFLFDLMNIYINNIT